MPLYSHSRSAVSLRLRSITGVCPVRSAHVPAGPDSAYPPFQMQVKNFLGNNGKGEIMKIKWNLKSAAAILAASSLVSPTFANEGAVPKGVPQLDHVFLIVMENHGYSQIVGNPNSPFTNDYLKHVNVGANYFAVAHPSSTNYLEIAGGSNFGVLNDNSPAWHDTCAPNLATGITSFDNSTPPNNLSICPIRGMGTEAATPALDFSNETSGPPGDVNIDGTLSIPAATNISGKS